MVPRPAPQSLSPPLIPEYYAGREVFITGATGFMGKVLVERLLWTCPEISRLHLLIRCKGDMYPEKRLVELKDSPVFDVIREKCPERLAKLSVVAGDITKPLLNMGIEALQRLNEVSVVFHSAATIKFHEPLALAVDQNFRSVLTVMELCDRLPQIQVLVYVSTAYSNAELGSIEERVYPAARSTPRLLALLEQLPAAALAHLTPKLISPKPNTYTFTKAMAESALDERARACTYATAIFRPSIVISSLRHPFPGWIENINGPNGFVVGIGQGVLHVVKCGGGTLDMVPVDMAIDTLIAIAWEVGLDDTREARVYNCSTCENPITSREFKTRLLRGTREHPFDNSLWYPFTFFTSSTVMFKLCEWVLQFLPLYTVDVLCRVCGVKQRLKMSTVCQRLRAMNDALNYFMMRQWQFSTDNVKRLKDRLAPADAAVFNLDPHTIDWDQHCLDFVKGTRKYLLGEGNKDIQKAQSRMQKNSELWTEGVGPAATELAGVSALGHVVPVHLFHKYTYLVTPIAKRRPQNSS